MFLLRHLKHNQNQTYSTIINNKINSKVIFPKIDEQVNEIIFILHKRD